MKRFQMVTVGEVFCLCAASLALVSDIAAQDKDKPDKRDLQAKAAAEQFIKAITKPESIDAIMLTVDVPFFFDGTENIKDRERLKKKIEPFLTPNPDQLEFKVRSILAFGSLPENIISQKDHQLLKEILDTTDRIVLCFAERQVIALAVRVQENNVKVVGFRSNLSRLALVIAAHEKGKGDKSTSKAREGAKETVRQFLKAAKAMDLDRLLKHADAPWYTYDDEIIKDRDALKGVLKSIVERVGQGRSLPEDVSLVTSYGEVRDVLFKEQQRGRADQVLTNNDWVVFAQKDRKVTGDCFLVRVREGKCKVVGVVG
jgi:hypothetical protein